ncbi:MAG TPA: MFS transporter, partial [Polyangiaceae bacterium]
MSEAIAVPIRWFRKRFDIRPGEGRVAGPAFLVLLLIVAAHTVLETARDALLLTNLPPRSLGIVYLAVAALTLPSAVFAGTLSEKLGARAGLAWTLVAAACVTSIFFFVPPSNVSVVVLYVVSGLIGAHLLPQFWALAARVFTVAEGRRLIAPIALAGVVGGLVGSGLAALALYVIPVQSLILVAAGAFLLAASVLASTALEERNVPPPGERRNRRGSAVSALREQPLLARIALLAVLSTAVVLTIDYSFKWTVASTVPAHELGGFFARYYAVVNGLSLLVQLFIGGALVRRMGVALAAAVTPSLLLTGAVGVLLSGGAAFAVYALRAIDGSLRHSIHRITMELAYFPVPTEPRERAKPVIDGTFARLSQAVTAATLLTLSELHVLSPLGLIAVCAALGACWLLAAATLRRPYLELLRRALSTGSLDVDEGPDELDISSAEVLVERLASRDSAEVTAAMFVLARRGRERLIPALVLYHQDERVLVQALSIFGASSLTNWIPLAEPLLQHPREAVRMAALRALASHNRLDVLQPLLEDTSSRVQGYAVLHLALRDRSTPLMEHPRIRVLLKQPGDIGAAERLGVLAAIADAPADPELATLLLSLAGSAELLQSAEGAQLLARAAIRQHDPRMIEPLIELLRGYAGREAARAALLDFGELAFAKIVDRLEDPNCERRLRVHLPRTVARFGTQRAADVLLRHLESEPDGLVRYKALRGLGRLVLERDVRVDRTRIERLAL